MHDERGKATTPHIPVPLTEEEWLSNRTLELINLISLTPLSPWDRATPWHQSITQIAPETTQWHDKDEYVARSYLAYEAKRLLAEAINNGSAPIYADLPGRGHQRLDPRLFFGSNAWNSTTMQTGRYMPLNESYGVDGPTRAAIRNIPLWIRNEDWPGLRDAILARRRELSGSSLPSEWQELISGLGFEDTAESAADETLTLHEAVLWVASANETAVAEQRVTYDRYVAKGPHAGPRAWVNVLSAISQRFCGCGAKPIDCYCTDEAIKILKRECANGRVPATGIPAEGSRRAPIGPISFTNAELTPTDLGSLIADTRHGGGILYQNLRFDRQAVWRLAEPSAAKSAATDALGFSPLIV
ncbi:hypothetical protein [Sphingomonas sp. PB4P5]|uniref:hypothetical protein n=1 Tax=Parasphingomonas puruogangriensis TaxID=3096155 RepID=UPI002FC6A229